MRALNAPLDCPDVGADVNGPDKDADCWWCLALKLLGLLTECERRENSLPCSRLEYGPGDDESGDCVKAGLKLNVPVFTEGGSGWRCTIPLPDALPRRPGESGGRGRAGCAASPWLEGQ